MMLMTKLLEDLKTKLSVTVDLLLPDILICQNVGNFLESKPGDKSK